MDEIIVGIDVGTTKICTLVGRVADDSIQILGVGIEPSDGIKKGVIIDLAAAIRCHQSICPKSGTNICCGDYRSFG